MVTKPILNWIKEKRCIKCGGETVNDIFCPIHREEENKLQMELKERQKKEVENNFSVYLERVGVPNKYIKARIENAVLLSEKVREKIKEVMNNNLFLYGVPGSGKTYIATAIMAEWIKKELIEQVEKGTLGYLSAKFVVVPDFFATLRKIWKEEAWRAVGNVANKKYLCLDDIGTEETRDFAVDIFYEIINIRYNNDNKNARMVITSNLSLEEIAEKIHHRLSSRLYEMCKVIKFPNKDLRKEVR